MRTRNVPPSAKLEAVISKTVAIWDVSRSLPRHDWKRWARRTKPIVRVYSHHSGAKGASGYAGAVGTARFAITHHTSGGTPGWAGAAYHQWLPFEPDRDPHGRLVVYRLNPDALVCYHTGGLNTDGFGLCWQGNLRRDKPSDAQYEMADALYPFLQRRLGVDRETGFSWHSEGARWPGGRSKETCPGPHVEAYVKAFRETQEPPSGVVLAVR